MRLLAYGHSDVGKVRKNNEDSYLIDDAHGLFAVCDGVGGVAGGEVASAMTVRLLAEKRKAESPRLRELGAQGTETALSGLVDHLDEALSAASEAVFDRGADDKSLTGMSTTAVAMAATGSRAALAYVGDSRIYLLRKGKLYQLSEDHSLAWELYRQGVLNSDDLTTFRYKNVIVRAIGQHPTVNVDTTIVEVMPDDVFLLCSDGVSDQMTDADIARVLTEERAEDAPGKLVELANLAGGKDNITAVVIRAEGQGINLPHMPTQEKVLALGAFFLFKDLTFQQTMRMLKIVEEKRYHVGDVVIREGELGADLFLLVRGFLSVTKDGVELNTLSKGKHFGELALISDQVRSATVTAMEDSLVLRVERDAFLSLLREDSVVAAKLLWRFLQETAGRIKDLSVSYAETIRKQTEDE
jgi:serine/threonine protein phosphatase PrpC